MAKIKEITLKLKLSNNGKRKIVNRDTIKHFDINQLTFVKQTLTDLNTKENILVNYPKIEDNNVVAVSLLGTIQDLIKRVDRQIVQIKSRPLNFNRSLGWKY